MAAINPLDNAYANAQKIQDSLSYKLVYTPPVITVSDVDDAYIVRYFARPANDIYRIIEIDKKQYSDVKDNPRFVAVKLRWKIVGKKDTITNYQNVQLLGVKDTNKKAVEKADLTFGALKNYIVDYAEYWQYEG